MNRIVPKLIRDGRITRPTLGVATASEGIQRAFRLPDGVALVQVAPNGPAARAGLQPFMRSRDSGIVQGDVITAINDEPIKSLDDMLTVLEKHAPGDTVTLSVWRAGRSRKQAVTLMAGD